MLAPTGSGKTLAAFLAAIDHVMFEPVPAKEARCRVLYLSPLKALAVDIERNLRAPIAGVSKTAERMGVPVHQPVIAVRTGDTPQSERAAFNRKPSDILITTPESLYLLLTSNAREALRSIRYVIVDEIHAVLATKRGAHLALSLERLQAITSADFQRIGLSATVRPLDEAARFLGGSRPVSIVNAGAAKELDITVEIATEVKADIWPAVQPRILELIRQHRTTLIFVNNRRLAERMAAQLNELAGEEIVRAHHGSVAREQRMLIEEQLKAGTIKAIAATSSLELGIDMGSIDLVIQVEAAPSVAAGLQRIGRAGHHIDVPSKGVIFPKYRGDLLASAALTAEMLRGAVETQRYPRNALDVLAQQIVAMVSMETWSLDRLHATIRRAAPFADISINILENVLDMLSGRYPSHEFADLRPRVVWDRVANTLRARAGAKHIAISNGGTIPDRGLFGVFLTGADPKQARVGELDEEMVFETRVGERFLLGATTWRVDDITPQRVLVSPAPGEPGKMPFWKGDAVGRPIDMGRAIGKLTRTLRQMAPGEAAKLLEKEHRLDRVAAKSLLDYINEQVQATGAVPDDETIVVERYMDDLGDWRVCILSPFGGKVHAPWTQSIHALMRRNRDFDVETLWSDDGIVVRLPETDEPPPLDLIIPDPDDIEDLVIDETGGSAMFASHFREAASRALLLPRRYPGQRQPLWQQRKRASDLLAITARYRDFPIILEVFRELLRDVYDMPALVQLMRDIRNRSIRVVTVNTKKASPFAASLMFGYVGNFVYDADAPLAERRAQALSIDQSQLRELLGESEIRELLDPAVIEAVELRLQKLDPEHRVKNVDGIHDLLLWLGDLRESEIKARCSIRKNVAGWLEQLKKERRAVWVSVAREKRWVAAEDVGRYRDALGMTPPTGVPPAFLKAVKDPLEDLAGRFARTRGPFTAEDAAQRLGLSVRLMRHALRRLEMEGRVVLLGPEWCDTNVLRLIRQKTLAKLRHQIEPVEHAAYGRFLPAWHRIGVNREGPEALLEVIGQIQGYAIPASVLEEHVLKVRLKNYQSGDLDVLISSGQVIWTGVESLGATDGRVALYLAENARNLLPPQTPPKIGGELSGSEPTNSPPILGGAGGCKNRHQIQQRIRDYLSKAGASFFPQILAGTDSGFRGETLDALWDLVWAGEVTNDTLLPLRAFLDRKGNDRRRRLQRAKKLARPTIAPEASGRWSLLSTMLDQSVGSTARLTALSRQLLDRLGVITREGVAGFTTIYPVLKAMEEAGRIRRGYFIAGRGAAQFADPGALERLRDLKEPADDASIVMLAATDPANPYGATLPWPTREDNRAVGRFAGAQVILVDGELSAYLSKSEQSVLTFFDPSSVDTRRQAAGIAKALANLVTSGLRRAVLIEEVNGLHPGESAMAGALREEGFRPRTHGWQFTCK